MARSSAFSRRWSKDHAGFNPLKQAGYRYRIEKRVGDTYITVSSTQTLDAAIRFLADKPEWTARVVRIRDNAEVWP